MTIRTLTASLLALSLGACATVPEAETVTAPAAPVTVRVVGLNDFHGNLEPASRPMVLELGNGEKAEVYAGGAAWMADAVAKLRRQDEYSVVIAAGDLISASPLASSLFLDEPTVGVMNRLQLDFAGVGNHEFDRGWQELKRLREGGCAQFTLRQPCAVEPDFAGTDFPFLAANVRQADGSTLFPGISFKRFGEGEDAVTVAVIGLTLKGTAEIVTPGGIAGLTFEDEAGAINALIPQAVAEGADAIIVAIHQGLVPEPGDSFNGCGSMAGDLRAILEQLDPRIDLVISGHTHQAYVCDFGTVDPSRGFTVTSAGSYGRMLTDIALTVDPRANDVIGVSARNVPVQSAGEGRPANPAYAQFAPVPEVAAYVARYVAASAEVASRPVGKVSGPALRGGHENALGNLIADAQLATSREAGAQIALMNPGGIRADLNPRADGTLTFGDIYAVQPFGNTVVTGTLTGAQLLAVLEQQFANPNNINVLSVSASFAMTLDPARPEGQRVVSASLDGVPIDPAADYRVSVNSFMASGGDGFSALKAGRDVVVGPLDLDAIEALFRSQEVVTLPATGRVTMIGG
jgi:5'-nucleotidase